MNLEKIKARKISTNVFLAIASYLCTVLLVFANEWEGFVTPSGNIACISWGGGDLRCDMSENLAPIPPQPSSCEFDWGNSFTLPFKGKASLLCVSDTFRDQSLPVLKYGKTWSYKGLVCKSAQNGLTCTNKNKHGFFLNKLEQRFF